jgi:EAL domain-containing protein (putative c-di-GMP-specific phosphodiesterase class I)
MASDSVNHDMVAAINDIGHSMGRKTIAEYVENEAILTRLREVGVDFAQGY